jgi:hypothetical protein
MAGTTNMVRIVVILPAKKRKKQSLEIEEEINFRLVCQCQSAFRSL